MNKPWTQEDERKHPRDESGKFAAHEMTRSEYEDIIADYESKKLKNDWLNIGGIPVVQNPTDRDYRDLNKDIRSQLPPDFPAGEITIRFTKDKKGNRWIWPADKAIHAQMEPSLASHLGVSEEDLKQSHEIPSHSDYIREAIREKKKVPKHVQEEYPHWEEFFRYARKKSSPGKKKFKWITIGGEPDGSGAKHVGGTPVQIDGDGDIKKGPPSLKGKDLDDLDKNVAGTKEDKRSDNPPPSQGERDLGQALLGNYFRSSGKDLRSKAESGDSKAKEELNRRADRKGRELPYPDSAIGEIEDKGKEKKPQTDLFGDEIKEKPKQEEFENMPGKKDQGKLFATGGLAGQKNLFADDGVPDDMVGSKPSLSPQEDKPEGRKPKLASLQMTKRKRPSVSNSSQLGEYLNDNHTFGDKVVSVKWMRKEHCGDFAEGLDRVLGHFGISISGVTQMGKLARQHGGSAAMYISGRTHKERREGKELPSGIVTAGGVLKLPKDRFFFGDDDKRVSTSGSKNPARAAAAHEAGHAVFDNTFYVNDDGEEIGNKEAWKQTLDEHGIDIDEWSEVSQYARDTRMPEELFCEITAFIADDRESKIPQKFVDAWNDFTSKINARQKRPMPSGTIDQLIK